MNKSGLLAEDNGNASTMRVMALLFTLTACFIVIWPVLHTFTLDPNVIAAAALMAGIGVTGKVVQKGKEEVTSDAAPKE